MAGVKRVLSWAAGGVARRLRNRYHRLAVALYRRGVRRPEGSALDDEQAYLLIGDLVPELMSYKESTRVHLGSRAKELGFAGLGEYYELLKDNPAELTWLRHSLTLKGSHFFRGQDWPTFDGECLSTFAGRDRVRVWCAGCSSGEEVYSTLMMLLDHVPLEAIDLLATDYDDELLERCQRGVYRTRLLGEVPERYRRYVTTSTVSDSFAIREDLCSAVNLRNVNLITDEYPAPFDVIVCRNVIKFFSDEVRERTKARLAASLAPGGFLFTSDDDNTNGKEMIDDPAALGLRQIAGVSIYQRVG